MNRKILAKVKRAGHVTIADVMAMAGATMREAYHALAILEAEGSLTRSGGGTGQALRWAIPNA